MNGWKHIIVLFLILGTTTAGLAATIDPASDKDRFDLRPEAGELETHIIDIAGAVLAGRYVFSLTRDIKMLSRDDMKAFAAVAPKQTWAFMQAQDRFKGMSDQVSLLEARVENAAKHNLNTSQLQSELTNLKDALPAAQARLTQRSNILLQTIARRTVLQRLTGLQEDALANFKLQIYKPLRVIAALAAGAFAAHELSRVYNSMSGPDLISSNPADIGYPPPIRLLK